MLKERGKWLQLRFNIPSIPENKRNVERMLKQNSFNIDSTSFQYVSTMLKGVANAFNIAIHKIERMLKQMLKPFARALICEKVNF